MLINNNTKLIVMLKFEENLHTIGGRAVPKLNENKVYSYKRVRNEEIIKHYFDRKTIFSFKL